METQPETDDPGTDAESGWCSVLHLLLAQPGFVIFHASLWWHTHDSLQLTVPQGCQEIPEKYVSKLIHNTTQPSWTIQTASDLCCRQKHPGVLVQLQLCSYQQLLGSLTLHILHERMEKKSSKRSLVAVRSIVSGSSLLTQLSLHFLFFNLQQKFYSPTNTCYVKSLRIKWTFRVCLFSIMLLLLTIRSHTMQAIILPVPWFQTYYTIAKLISCNLCNLLHYLLIYRSYYWT